MTPQTTGEGTLSEELQRKEFSPVYYLFGDEDLLLEEATEDLVDAILRDSDRGFNLDVLRANDIETREILTRALTYPLMADRRVVVVNEAEKMTAEAVSSYLKKPSPTTALVMVSHKPDKRRALHKLLRGSARAFEFKKLYERSLPGWITARASRDGFKIDSKGLGLLIEYSGTSLREVYNELQKLYAFVGTRKTISVEDVQAVTGVSREFSVYELRGAVAKRDPGRSIRILSRMLEAGQSPVFIAVVLARYFIDVKKYADARKRRSRESGSRLAPWILNDCKEAVKHYSEDDLDAAIISISSADELLKTTSVSEKSVLHFMTASILAGSGNSTTP